MPNVNVRDRRATSGNFAPVLDGRDGQRLGSFIPRQIAGDLVGADCKVTLEEAGGNRVTLATQADWDSFCDNYLRAPDNSGLTDLAFIQNDPKGLVSRMGMSYENLCRLLDDIASEVQTPDKPDGLTGQSFVVDRSGQWNQVAAIYQPRDTYGANVSRDVQVPIAPGSNATVSLSPSKPITAEILGATERLTRDRTETEKWIGVVVTDNRTDNVFREMSGNECFQPLDISKLGPYQENNGIEHIWQDDRAVELLERFPYPMHLERDRDDDTGYQQNRSPFLEVFPDTPDFKLLDSGRTLRPRWRPEQNGRTNLQGKQTLGINPDTGLMERHKFEHRGPDGSNVTRDGVAYHLDELEEMALSGRFGRNDNRMSSVHRILYQGLVDDGALRRGDPMPLESKVCVYQDRRRTHLVFYSDNELQTQRRTLQDNLDNFDTLTNGADPAQAAQWKSNLERMIGALDSAIAKIEHTQTTLRKYSGSFSAWGDGLIISRDEKCGFESAAFGGGTGIWPADRRGRPAHWVPDPDGPGEFIPQVIDGADRIDPIGPSILRAEAELDAAASDPVDRAIERCRELAQGTGAQADQARADLPELEKIRNEMSLCTDAAMEVQAEAYESAGLTVDRDPPPDSTYEVFGKMLKSQRPRAWFAMGAHNMVPRRPAPAPAIEVDKDIIVRAHGRTAALDPIQVTDATTLDFEVTPRGSSRSNDMDLYVRIGSPPEINADGTGTFDLHLGEVGSRESGSLDVPANSEVYVVARSKGGFSNANIRVTS
ncbi:MAG: hypothetical protein RIT81_04610 [Deltaproteobacteria bacterium]